MQILWLLWTALLNSQTSNPPLTIGMLHDAASASEGMDMSNPVMNRTMDRLGEETVAYGRSGVEIPTLTGSQLTIAGTMNRTLALFGVMLLTAAVAWVTPLGGLFWLAGLVGFGLAMWASFSKKVRPTVIMLYAVAQGIFLSGLSQIFETAYPGIVQNAVLATTVTAGVMFVAYRQRWVKVTARFRSFMMFAILGYLAFALVNLGFVFFTGGGGVFSSSFGWLVALFGVGLASFTLLLDFADIETAANVGVPVEYEWRFAFGLMVSIVWMYTEILRLLAILRGDD